jgi:hypothetical protein
MFVTTLLILHHQFVYCILSWHFVINSHVKLTEYGVGVHDVGVYVPGVWTCANLL